ncbi:MAG: histidine--tRNA ligase [Bacteroides sp.]|nr:histidine--tRNA ligase [Prevotella sp.]MCM1408394.1 histidine--tRNA ligase [Treponema brennaborense]MCM1469444.1 histidine--tRNA ligase [Bacteroides sp.]
METFIQPKVLKGFRDFLPAAEIRRSILIEKLTSVFRMHGFVPIDTPVLEYSEILLRKSSGETEKQVFRFQDNGKRDVALRFDLTVPFARFIAEHKEEIYFPFKRYHIAKVWRGEKPQAGRYREFVQCDFDSIGSDSAAADFEILDVMKHALDAAGAGKTHIRLNHRGIFNAFLKKNGLAEKSEDILRTVDKSAKIGAEQVKLLLSEICAQHNGTAAADDGTEKAELILRFIDSRGSFSEILERIGTLAGEASAPYVQRLRDIQAMACAAGSADTFVLDPSITRGLDYYTGIVYETFLDALPGIGSVCSGGRYDNLAGLYMKEKISGVGASVGLDRLIAALETLEGENTAVRGSFLDAEIFCQDERLFIAYQSAAQKLREAGIAAEVFPEAKKMPQQYAVAEKKNIPFGIFITAEDAENRWLTLKDLRTREQYEHITIEQAAEKIRAAR